MKYEIKKGFKKTAKAVFFKKAKCTLSINGKKWNEYFNDKAVTNELSILINKMEEAGHDLSGFIKCYGGGFKAQLKAISDAIMRICGIKPEQDTRQRWRNKPGLRGVNKGAVHNKR